MLIKPKDEDTDSGPPLGSDEVDLPAEG